MADDNLNQRWNIVNWTLRNKLQWNFNRKPNMFIQDNAFESVVCEMAAIFSRPQCVNSISQGAQANWANNSNNSLSGMKRFANIWNNVCFFINWILWGTAFCEILFQTHQLSYRKFPHVVCKMAAILSWSQFVERTLCGCQYLCWHKYYSRIQYD